MRMLSPLSTWSWSNRPSLSSEVFTDFDRAFDSFFGQTPTKATADYTPAVDVRETKTQYLISFDIPGTKKEDVKIEVDGKYLKVSGERTREVQEGEENGLRFERYFGKFERTFVLPESTNADKIEARHENGVLHISLPKAEAAKARTIQIN